MSRFDVVVVGGGPAGMMAAARAAQYGARVALVEKNKDLGMKLMITGRGRCNFAHDEDDPEVLAKGYRNGSEFILPSLKKFGTKETTAFFQRRGVVAVQERGHRLYPREGQDASSVVNAMWTALKDGGVQVLRGIEVRNLDLLGKKARRLITTKQEIDGNAFIIATGGLSFPNTGSTGDGYRFAKKAGHSVTDTRPALCPIKIAERVSDYLDGLKLKNVRTTLTKDTEKVDERFGEMDFTHFGISGAIIMDMASSVDMALKSSPNVKIHIDLKPALEPERLDARIDRDFEEFKTDALRFALRKMLPGQIIPEVIERAKLDLGKPCGETSREEREALRNVMKDYTVTPTALLGFRHAIITTGGINTNEIDPETMRSKFIQNLYFAGEVLDVDGPTGGYNLQECWTTGFTAGSAAAEALGFKTPTDEEIVQQMYEAQSKRDEADREKWLEARRLEEEKQTAETTSEDDKESQETTSEEATDGSMTIKTGPTDDKEFCGWKDPRKDGNTNISNAESAERHNNDNDGGYSRNNRDSRAPRNSGGRDTGCSRFEKLNSTDRRKGNYGEGRRDDSRPFRDNAGEGPYEAGNDRSYDRRNSFRNSRYGDRQEYSEEGPYSDRRSSPRPFKERDGKFEERSQYGSTPRRTRDDRDRYSDSRRDERISYRDERDYRDRRGPSRPFRDRDDEFERRSHYGSTQRRMHDDRDGYSASRRDERANYRDEGGYRDRRGPSRPFRDRDDEFERRSQYGSESRRTRDDRDRYSDSRRNERINYRDEGGYRDRRSSPRTFKDRDGKFEERPQYGDRQRRSRDDRDYSRTGRFSDNGGSYKGRGEKARPKGPASSHDGFKGSRGDKFSGSSQKGNDIRTKHDSSFETDTSTERVNSKPQRRKFTNFAQFRKK